MAERHSIVVYVRGGQVERIAFCDCCPPVSVEVRTYDAEQHLPPAPAEPMFPQHLGEGRWRDHEGTYHPAYYESDDE